MSKMKPFKYKGYTELCELGRYYTVHLKNKTKLYSCVNFLHASNLKLMQNIIGSIIWENIKVVNYNGTVHEV